MANVMSLRPIDWVNAFSIPVEKEDQKQFTFCPRAVFTLLSSVLIKSKESQTP